MLNDELVRVFDSDTAQNVVAYLERARQRGFLGPGDYEQHLVVTRRFFQRLPDGAFTALDLGSGSGVPGLLLALARPQSRWVLLDAMQKRCAFLSETAAHFGMADRVHVECGRAEELGRDQRYRAGFDVVVSRGFGPPAVTAECGAVFLRRGGVLCVSEPGDGRERWDSEGLALLGLEKSTQSDVWMVELVARAVTPDRFPRRTGVPLKRPLF